MLPKADLHIHTNCSDGRLTPAEAVELASEKKLKALSITDHDTFEGYFKGLKKAKELDIELIPGVEITSSYKSRESHILAYYFDVDTTYFADFLLSQRVARRDRIKGIIQKVNKVGVDITYEEVRSEANGANIGRPHLAKILIQKGYVNSSSEAFKRYLSTEKLGEIDNNYPDFKEVIKIIKNVGGASVLAHPSRFYTKDEINEFVAAGIDGIECIHPSHNWKMQKEYTEFVEKNSLLLTGGSDYHGGKDLAYTHLGVVCVASKHCDKMKRMTDQRKQLVELKK